MPRVLLVAATTGYQTRMFADAARQLGFDLVLATDRCHVLDDPWGDRAVPVHFEDPNGACDALMANGPFDAVTAVADRGTLVASITAEALGLPHNSPAAIAASRDKFLARQRFQAYNSFSKGRWCGSNVQHISLTQRSALMAAEPA